MHNEKLDQECRLRLHSPVIDINFDINSSSSSSSGGKRKGRITRREKYRKLEEEGKDDKEEKRRSWKGIKQERRAGKENDR